MAAATAIAIIQSFRLCLSWSSGPWLQRRGGRAQSRLFPHAEPVRRQTKLRRLIALSLIALLLSGLRRGAQNYKKNRSVNGSRDVP